MSCRRRSALRLLGSVALGGAMAISGGVVQAQEKPAAIDARAVVTVDGRVALHALSALTDAHLQKMADVLALIASTDAVRSAQWERVRVPLADAARLNVPAVLWFALPSGTYWTLAHGRADATLLDRAYFPGAVQGQSVFGELVVSHSTHRNTAIVAVPVRNHEGTVVGVLGSSIHLDSLSALVRDEMGGLDDGLFFFAINDEPIGAIHSDSTLIFTEPMKLGDEGMRRAFEEIVSSQEGTVTYAFRGGTRTVVYRRSPVTGWWYGLGMVEP